MAKVPFTKLKCKINEEIKQVKLNDEITIEVKQYLPIQEKLALISEVIMMAHEPDANYSNPIKLKSLKELYILFNYTNIAFTDKQKEDLPKLYDICNSSGLINIVLLNIPTIENEAINDGINMTVEAVYNYQNSVLGILDTIKTDYSDTKFDIEQLSDMLGNTDLTLIQEVMNKLG